MCLGIKYVVNDSATCIICVATEEGMGAGIIAIALLKNLPHCASLSLYPTHRCSLNALYSVLHFIYIINLPTKVKEDNDMIT